MISITANDITIAVTVYDRRDYVLNAVESALQQDLPVSVMVVEDHSPDESMREFIENHFGGRITYHRNPTRRGLFGNWNACIEFCETPYLCILHDDDFLEPGFAATLLRLVSNAPRMGLYYGNAYNVDDMGRLRYSTRTETEFLWEPINLLESAYCCPFPFPAHIFSVSAAKELGGFSANSHYTGDWEMWFKLGFFFGAAKTNQYIANVREHVRTGRGSTTIDRAGKRFGLTIVQAKRNIALLRRNNPELRFDRVVVLRNFSMPIRYFLSNGSIMPLRLLKYNIALLLRAETTMKRHFLFKILVRLGGAPLIRILSTFLPERI